MPEQNAPAPITSVQRIRQLEADREHLERQLATQVQENRNEVQQLLRRIDTLRETKASYERRISELEAERDKALVDQEELSLARSQIQIVREIAKGMTKGDAER